MLEARDVAFSYTKDRPILKAMNALVEPGVFLAILGVNGCGKSTLLSCRDDVLSQDSVTILLEC